MKAFTSALLFENCFGSCTYFAFPSKLWDQFVNFYKKGSTWDANVFHNLPLKVSCQQLCHILFVTQASPGKGREGTMQGRVSLEARSLGPFWTLTTTQWTWMRTGSSEDLVLQKAFTADPARHPSTPSGPSLIFLMI